LIKYPSELANMNHVVVLGEELENRVFETSASEKNSEITQRSYPLTMYCSKISISGLEQELYSKGCFQK